MTEQMTVKEAIGVILSDKAHYTTSLNWAVNYCRAAMDMEGRELKMQIAYILSNITKWRHEKAKAVREVLKAAIK
jgi:hypothetical protein